MLVIKDKLTKPFRIEKKIIDDMEGVIDEYEEYMIISDDHDGVTDDRNNPFDSTIPITVEIKE